MTNYTLQLEFDINQITRSLQHNFKAPKGYQAEKYGPLAGTAHFEQGDELDISITATGRAENELSLKVMDCSVVTVGTADLGKLFLSPFAEETAVVSVSDWKPTKNKTTEEDKEADRQRLSIKSGSPFAVIAPAGQWRFSGYLSVQIIIDGQTYYRLFYFDPEGSVGNGGGFGWPN